MVPHIWLYCGFRLLTGYDFKSLGAKMLQQLIFRLRENIKTVYKSTPEFAHVNRLRIIFVLPLKSAAPAGHFNPHKKSPGAIQGFNESTPAQMAPA
jgi:hypothetical protein